MKWHQYPVSARLALLAAFACVAAVACPAQWRPPYRSAAATMQAATKPLNQQPAPVAAPQPVAPRAAPSLLTHPAQAAKITLSDGKLTIQADNSALGEILEQIARSSGMKIVGLESGNADQRIFGSYGPGAPRSVLSSLLNGTGYNVLMLGRTASGVPQHLTLSSRPSGGVPNPSPTAASQYNSANNYNYIQPTPYQNQQNSRPAPAAHPAGANGVRTPQQILQELEQMRRRAPIPPPNN